MQIGELSFSLAVACYFSYRNSNNNFIAIDLQLKIRAALSKTSLWVQTTFFPFPSTSNMIVATLLLTPSNYLHCYKIGQHLLITDYVCTMHHCKHVTNIFSLNPQFYE